MKNKDHTNNIWDRLKSKPDGFLAPGGYLENLEERILAGTQEQLTAFGEQPAKIDRTSVVYRGKEKAGEASDQGFRVPAGYFDGLEKRLIDKLASERRDKTWWDRNWVFTLSIAASLLLLLGIRLYSPHGASSNLNTLSTSEIDTWVDNGLVSFSSYDIAEAFNDVELYPDLGSEQEVLDYLGEVDVENLMTEN